MAAVEALAVVAEAAVAWELARAAREKFGGDALADFVAAHPRVPRAHRMAPHALDRHIALIGFMGAGKSTLGAEARRRLERPFVDLDREIEEHAPIGRIFATEGEPAFRAREAKHVREALQAAVPSVVALGAARSAPTRFAPCCATTPSASTSRSTWTTAWARSQGTDRPLAVDEARFRELYEQRAPLYREVADGAAGDLRRQLLAAGGVHVEPGSLERLGELLPGQGAVEMVADARVAGIYGMEAQLALGGRLARPTSSRPARRRRQWPPSTGSGESSGSTAAARSSRSAAGARRTRRARRGDLPARDRLGGRPDDPRRPGRRRHRRQDRDRPPRRQEPRRRVPLARPHGHRPGASRHAARGRAPRRARRAREDRAARRRAALGAAARGAVRACAAFKTAVCLRDPHDRGDRRQLNLGHTFAHALEAAAGYELPHGRAVALGLLAALRLSGLATTNVERELRPEPVRLDRERAWTALARDKKAERGVPQLVLLEAPGTPGPASSGRRPTCAPALDSLIAE